MTARVVLAEDEAIIRLDLAEMLAEEGYQVVGQTGRGDEVVDLVRQLKPDLVVMDVKMPGLDGLSAARLITNETLAAVVVLTAFSQRELIETARDAGVMAYLVKPFQQHEQVAAIEIAIARYREQAERQVQYESLEDQLATRKLVDRAKARLISQGMSEPEAFKHVQRLAMDTRSSMRQVAERILAG